MYWISDYQARILAALQAGGSLYFRQGTAQGKLLKPDKTWEYVRFKTINVLWPALEEMPKGSCMYYVNDTVGLEQLRRYEARKGSVAT